MRALGSIGEPERDSCSVVQHSFEAMVGVRKSSKRTREDQRGSKSLLTRPSHGVTSKHRRHDINTHRSAQSEQNKADVQTRRKIFEL
jgi:hypothetical protein